MGNVKKINSPLLVIGLGGTGADGLLRVKSEFARHFECEKLGDGTTKDRPSRTEYLAIDTDAGVGNLVKHGMKLASDEFCYIGGDNKAIFAALKEKQYVSEWVDRRIANYKITSDGAGGIRQVSRLFLFHNFNKIKNAIDGKISSLSRVEPGTPAHYTEVQVRIIAGISGGTGSGTLLDVAYIIRELARQKRINVKAFLIMPDVTVDYAAQGQPAMKNILQTNSYCLLKELDYWMEAERNGLKFVQQYTDADRIAWDGAPFTNVYLQCAKNEAGVAIKEAYNYNLEIIAEYLMHCFEGNQDPNNAGIITEGMEVLNAKDQGAANTENSFSFMAADSNADTIVSQMNQEYPIPYRYHTLGAFSNAGEDRLMELTEWEMIYTETTKHFADNECHMDGHAPVEFKEKVLGFAEAGPSAAGQVRQKYEEKFEISNFRNLYTNGELRQLAADATPHGSSYVAFETQLREAHGDCKTAMADQVWNVFMTEAREIAEDLNRGPAYLLDLLQKGQNSLSVALDQFIAANEEKMNKASSGKKVQMSDAQTQFDVFMGKNVISRFLGLDKDPYDVYMNLVEDLYGAARAYEYYRALQFALTEYRQKLARFTAVLSDMVAQIKKHQAETAQELSSTAAPTTLFDTSAMKTNLTQMFAEQERKDTFTRAMFKQILEITVKCMSDTIKPADLPGLVDDAIDALRENQFVEVGGLSLSQKISNYNNIATGKPMQQYVKDVLAAKFDEGARPLFSAISQTADLDENHAARVSIVSVPNGEVDIFQGIKDYCDNHFTVIMKRTPNANRVFWVNDKAGLPMYFYDQLPILRDAYSHSTDTHVGYHLFMSDVEVMADARHLDCMKQNWRNAIPAPTFNRTARDVDPNSKRLEAAENAGSLEYTFNLPYGEAPSVKIEAVYLKKIDGVIANEETVGAKLDAAKVDIKSVLELPLAERSLEDLNAKLAELRELGAQVAAIAANPVREELAADHMNDKAKGWGNVLGIFNELQFLQADAVPTINESRANAWKTAYTRAIREMLSRRPYLLARLDGEVACRNMIVAKQAEINEAIAAVQGRITAIENNGLNVSAVKACAEKIARMVMCGTIAIKPMKVVAFPGTEDERDLFSLNETETPSMAAKFENYRRFALPVRLAGYLSHEAKGKTLPDVIEEETAKKWKKISNQDDASEIVREAYNKAQSIKKLMVAAKNKAKNDMLDDIITKQENDFNASVLDSVIGVLDQFIGPWEPYM